MNDYIKFNTMLKELQNTASKINERNKSFCIKDISVELKALVNRDHEGNILIYLPTLKDLSEKVGFDKMLSSIKTSFSFFPIEDSLEDEGYDQETIENSQNDQNHNYNIAHHNQEDSNIVYQSDQAILNILLNTQEYNTTKSNI